MKKLTFEEYVAKASIAHDGAYTYPEQPYDGKRAMLTILCRLHGEFLQNAGNHVYRRAGCPLCGTKAQVEKRITGLEEFVRRGALLYPGKDLYDMAVYKNTMTPLILSCVVHGQYSIRPHNYLRMGQRCTRCTKESGYTPNAHKQRVSQRELERRKTDPIFALCKRLRKRLRESLAKHHTPKDATLRQALGCSYEELRDHIEQGFSVGMGWHNMDKWHIDHRTPLATAQTREDVLRLSHYTNLQPLWAQDNLRKNARLDWKDGV